MFRILCLLILSTFFSGCRVVEQNQIALVLRSLGDREAEIANKNSTDNFSSDLLTASRISMSDMVSVGTKVLIFPRGLQYYNFTQNPSVYSSGGQGFLVNSIDGQISFDVAVHMYLDTELPDFKDRLVNLVKTYNLRKYSSKNNVLSAFIKDRFVEILKKPFMEYCANKRTTELMRNKDELNLFAKEQLNEKFLPLGLRFTLVAARSNFRISAKQQERLNNIVAQDVKSKTLKIQNESIAPLELEIQKVKLEGDELADQIVQEANSKSIQILTEAEKYKKGKFISLMGVDNYTQWEIITNLAQSVSKSNTELYIVPKNSSVLLKNEKFNLIK